MSETKTNDTLASKSLLKRFGFWIGLLFLAGALLIPPPGQLSLTAWRTAMVALLMAVWWMTEALPIPVTALAPIVLFPLFGIAAMKETTAPFAHPIIFLFMGGFVLAQAMQRSGLHRRLALLILAALGDKPRDIVAGFMIATAFISMWVSNTATTMMMLPIALSVIELGRRRISEAEGRRFSIVLLLDVAYASSIGGLSTLIGTPPNALLAALMEETFDLSIGFAQWMAFGVPLSLSGLIVAYWLLNFVIYPIRSAGFGGREFVREELARLGAMSSSEKRIAVIFVFTALMWMTRPLLQKLIPGLSDAGIAIFSAILTFIIPEQKTGGRSLMNWWEAAKLPWGILLLFGGGLSLAHAIGASGLSEWIGRQLHGLGGSPLFLIVGLAVGLVIFLTELTSNTATAATFLPILAALAVSLGAPPMVLTAPAAAAATCAFMLPVATPPNAIIYGSGEIEMRHMVKAGLALNIVFTMMITAAAFLLVPLVF